MSVNNEVLVVGAGPVGLALAAELEMAGVHAIVLEQLAEPDLLEKARGIGPLASEALRRRGFGPLLQTRHQSGQRDYFQDLGNPHAHFAWIHKLESFQAEGDHENRVGSLI